MPDAPLPIRIPTRSARFRSRPAARLTDLVALLSVGALLWGALLAPGASVRGQDAVPVPAVECVLDLWNGLYAAYFGYANPAERDILLLRGPENRLDVSTPENQQPPQRFSAGGSDPYPNSAFLVVFDSAQTPAVSWTLAGQTVTATPQSPPCPLADGAFQIEIDPATTTHTVSGFGGAFGHFFSKTRADDLGAYDAVARETLAGLRPTHIRVGAELVDWEPANDNDDSQQINWDGFRDEGLVRDIFTFMQDRAAEGAVIIASVWQPPAWTVENPDDDTRQVFKPGMEDEIVESLLAWLLHARDAYGVTVDYVSFNETDLGTRVWFEDPADYAAIIARAGPRFAAAGLPTRWALGDTSKASTLLDAAAPVWANPDVRPYIGVLAYHSWDLSSAAGELPISDAALGRIADYAAELGVDLWITEAGFDSAAWQTPNVFRSWDYALQLATAYSRLFKFGRANVAFYWQLMNDYPVVSADGRTRFPSFTVLQQFRDYVPPGAQIVGSSRNGPELYALAAQAPAGFTVHLTHTGDLPQVADLRGLPPGTYYLLRSSGVEPQGVIIGRGAIGDDVLLPLLPRSVTVLTTIPPQR